MSVAGRNTLIVMATVLAVLGVGVGMLATVRERHYRQVRRYEAACMVARAAIECIREEGLAPPAVSILYERDILSLDERTGVVHLMPRGQHPPARASDVRSVVLTAPRSSEGYTVVDGRVVRGDTGEEVVLVQMDGLDPGMQRDANRALATDWYAAMRALEARQGSDSTASQPAHGP